MSKIITGFAPMAASTDNPNFDSLPSELKGVAISQGHLLPTYSYNALEEVLDGFDVIHNDGKTPLYTWEFIDIIKKAEDTFNPGVLASAKARIPAMQDYEIDAFISRSQLMSIYRSYQKWLFGLTSLDDALKGQFAIYFLQTAMQKLMVEKIAQKGVWKGTRTATQADRGADKSFKGMLTTLAAGANPSTGDIPAANIFTADEDGIVLANAYDEIQGVCQKAYASQELKGVPMNVYLSHELYSLFNQARHAKSPNSVALGSVVSGPDYMPNLTFKPQMGLAGSDKVVVTPKSNFVFSVDSTPTNHKAELHSVMKGFQMNLLSSGGVDYGYGPAIFMNDAL